MSHSLKGTATLLGFTFGVSSAGISITDGVLSLLATINKIATPENYAPSLSSAIALTFSTVTTVLSSLMVRGSIWIWRFSVYGGAVNLSLGVVLVLSSYGVISSISDQITRAASDGDQFTLITK